MEKTNTSSNYPGLRRLFPEARWWDRFSPPPQNLLTGLFGKIFEHGERRLAMDKKDENKHLRDRYFTNRLEQWTEEQGIPLEQTEHRKAAAEKIKRCYANGDAYLNLLACQLSSLPNYLHFLLNLKTLDLSGNQIVSFDPTHPLPASLTTLHLGGNQIVSFDPTHPLPASLQTLNLTGNKIVSFDPTRPLPASLQTLNLTGNKIVSFDPTHPLPASLQTLNLAGNQIVSFDPTHPLPASLQTLNLADNQIVSFDPTYPLPALLIVLNLRFNRIVSFDPTRPLPASLQTLDFTGNQIVFDPTRPLPASLQTLNLTGNKIVSFDPTRPLPASLQTLNLSYNRIVSFDPTRPLPASLQTLDLTRNQIASFDPTRPLPVSLRNLNLAGNQIVLGRIGFRTYLPPALSLSLSENPFTEVTTSPAIWLRVPSGMIRDLVEGTLRPMGIEVLPRPRTDLDTAALSDELAALVNNRTPLTETQQREFEKLLEHKDAGNLAGFIRRMMRSWPQYDNELLSLINLAKENPPFLDLLFEEVVSTSTNCSERPLYFFSRLSAQAKPYENKDKPQELVQNLIAAKYLDLIEKSARQVSEGEALEFAIYLQLQLKHVLNLPIAIKGMAHEAYVVKTFKDDPKRVKAWVDEVSALCLSISATEEQKIEILAESRFLQRRIEHVQEFKEKILELQKDYATAYDIFDLKSDEVPSPRALEIANAVLGDKITGRDVAALQAKWNSCLFEEQSNIIKKLQDQQPEALSKLRAKLTILYAKELLSGLGKK